jgi:transglutaminase-like putative cysteine protease
MGRRIPSSKSKSTSTFIITQIKDGYSKTKNNTSMDVSSVRRKYQIIINDGTIVSPFVISSELAAVINTHTKGLHSDEAKAKAIFDWMENNIEYGNSKRMYGYSTAKETLHNRQGICGELAFLYCAMGRNVGLQADFVRVYVDFLGKKVDHGCAMVDFGYETMLVDPAYHQYGINHLEFRKMSDVEVNKCFEQWRYID